MRILAVEGPLAPGTITLNLIGGLSPTKAGSTREREGLVRSGSVGKPAQRPKRVVHPVAHTQKESGPYVTLRSPEQGYVPHLMDNGRGFTPGFH